MQPKAVKQREAHLKNQGVPGNGRMEKQKSCLFGNITAAFQPTGAVLRAQKKQQFCRDVIETWLGSGRFLDKTAQSTAGQRAQHRPDLGHSTTRAVHSLAENSTMPQEMPPAWSLDKDQLRIPVPRDKQGTGQASQVNVKCSCLPEMGMQFKKPHSNICAFLHLMCEAQLPRWFSAVRKAQGTTACKWVLSRLRTQ